ncbi:MAG: KpsF/GutQ family sugar-phosphate isomerase [Proteobacteria bacterium]|nr:KpsF/GutQ family sugar-phosphate isomerase [Pseudomonadota bacterium]
MIDFLKDEHLLKIARTAMRAESSAVEAAAGKLDNGLVTAVNHVLALKGKVVTTGIGKSGHVAHKIASTLASTGTPSFYLHPAEAMHGDMGVISEGDALLAVAFGGETLEVLDVCKYSKRLGNMLIAITGKLDSSLGKVADYLLDGSVDREVCPLNLAPTASTAVALSLGDALAVCLMHSRGFSEVNFASLHPGGSLGRALSTVQEHMHSNQGNLATVTEEANFHTVLEAVTRNNFGIVAVIDSLGNITGAISDGDIRRSLLKLGAGAINQCARDLKSHRPRCISSQALAIQAFREMESNQITSLFVTEARGTNKLIGIVRMHDLLSAKIV